MQIPLPLAEEIIGVRGQTIASIRSVSGAVVVLEETGDYLEEVLVTVEGSSSQVQTAHQLIQVNYLCPDESCSCIQSLIKLRSHLIFLCLAMSVCLLCWSTAHLAPSGPET
jgi:hypothetical protein